MSKIYLGDGVYAEYDPTRDMIRLTTENGISVDNEIWLEPEVANALKRYIEKIRPQ